MKKHGDHGHSCNHKSSSRIYIPRDRMSTVDKLLDDKLFKSQTFFTENNHKNMHAVLEQVHQSFSSILERGKKQKNLTFEGE